MVLFLESAFKHGYEPGDFFEVLEQRPMKLRSQRGLAGVYEILGRNYVGDYLHIVYRKDNARTVVFHMRRMRASEKRRYLRLR